jgi:hypothetical protein
VHRALVERVESLNGSDYERLASLGDENRFRLQLGKPERGASDDVEKAVSALFAVEVEEDDADRLPQRFGVVAVPPRLLNSWSLLELLDATPFIATKTKLQKMLFALQESLEVDGRTGPRLRFKRFVYGPYASSVDSLVTELARLALVDVAMVRSASRFELTDRGRGWLATLREVAPNYEHLRTMSVHVAKRLGSVQWAKVRRAAYADPLVRGRAMNDALLPLDRRSATTPGLAPNPGKTATRVAVAEGDVKAFLN